MSDKIKGVTIKDVANAASVSTQTISRVINRSPNVTAKTRQKVLAVIEELGYQPSMFARGLAANRTRLIAMLYDNPNYSYVYDFQRGVLSCCADEGYELIVHPCKANHSGEIQRVTNSIRRLNVDGVILLPPLEEFDHVMNAIRELQCGYVFTSPTTIGERTRMVMSNYQQFTGRIAEHLVSLGHQRIACITGPMSQHSSQAKLEGFAEYLQEKNIELRKDNILEGGYDVESGERCALDLMTRSEPPTAIFASNDLMAVGALRAAQRLGITVPDDLSIAGFDDAPIAQQVWPALTTLRAPAESLGRLAAQKLIGQSKDTLQGDASMFECELVVRETTGPVPD